MVVMVATALMQCAEKKKKKKNMKRIYENTKNDDKQWDVPVPVFQGRQGSHSLPGRPAVPTNVARRLLLLIFIFGFVVCIIHSL